MTKIIKFPGMVEPTVEARPAAKTAPTAFKGKGFLDGVVKTLWVMTVLVWPLLRWVAALDVVFQFARMLWKWDTPGAYAGWTFLLHFAVLTALTYFVTLYKPKGL
ncbi:hypothetical protein R69658_05962 [Paraburkholderia aspalathi]|uniref:Protein kleE n=1 Tax=Paraburkholderia aspalathi TaxID=1324617 RepID=A0ABM8SP34_9BURK|nr:KleE stable inheritance protein [Paraburkholderia aspalathi]MBK3822234.1 protein kleE [Paraburkholderia aspalathi]MBK3834054.1 protein kleE [Paraburkholderia aspalathi]MBK3863802.1 protein kleE [Paraburkholderia aspalathi]CAE6823575.1 hypothetical protein R69658_05962 [Paraburkholderia aspalathi]